LLRQGINSIIFCVIEKGESDDGGILRSGIINWYLEQIEDQINDETELLEKKSFIEKILDRLIYNVSILRGRHTQMCCFYLKNLSPHEFKLSEA